MSFSVYFGSGALQTLGDNVLQQALQFPESVQRVCPGVDLLLLTDVHSQVFYALGGEFTVCDTLFGGCVATKWNVTNWTENRSSMCRFDINNKVTVTFGHYSTLYNLENDFATLSQKPHYFQHFICLVIQRSLNWKAMVILCSRVLQIQYPTFTAGQCPVVSADNIVLMGWQKYSAVSYSAPLLIEPCLPLSTPVPNSGTCWPVTKFNPQPVYVLSYVMFTPRVRALKKPMKLKQQHQELQLQEQEQQEQNVQLQEQKQQEQNVQLQEQKQQKQNVQLQEQKQQEQNVQLQEQKQQEQNVQVQEPNGHTFLEPSEDEWVITIVYENE